MKNIVLLLFSILIVSILSSCAKESNGANISHTTQQIATETPIIATETPIITTETPIITTENKDAPVGPQYKLEITGSGGDNIYNELKPTYAPDEKVTLILGWQTESYYLVYANGVEVKRDVEANDDWYAFAYYTFTMPSEDVLVTIEIVSVTIPWE